jgi:hypothetical protein
VYRAPRFQIFSVQMSHLSIAIAQDLWNRDDPTVSVSLSGRIKQMHPWQVGRLSAQRT